MVAERDELMRLMEILHLSRTPTRRDPFGENDGGRNPGL